MSDNSTLSALAQENIPQIPAIFAGNYATLCAAVLQIYDYFLTFPLEMRHIWKNKMNIMKILFIMNRYFGLIYVYSQVLLYLAKPVTNMECRAFNDITSTSNILSVFAVFSIFTLRTYAIYGRNRIILFLLAAPAFVALSSGIWEVIVQTAAALPPQLQIGPLNCIFNASSSVNAAGLVNIVSAAVFNVLVVVFTVYRIGRLALQSRKGKIKESLSPILLRDGMIYYAAIFVPQYIILVLAVIVMKTGSNDLDDASNALSYVNASLQIVLINRLVLNLCHAANSHEDSAFRTRSGLEPLSFASGSVLGNIGGPVPSFPTDLVNDNEMPDTEGEESVKSDNVRGDTFESFNANEREGQNADNSSLPSVVGETSV